MANETENPAKRHEEDAAQWHIRLHSGEATGADWSAFTDWLEADPDRRPAYEVVADVARTAEASANVILQALEEMDTEEAAPQLKLPEAQTANTDAGSTATVIDARARFRRPVLATLMSMAAMLFIAVSINIFMPADPISQSFVTAMGETRNVTLADGSIVHLNTNTRLDVTIDGTARRTILHQGEALFEVAKDKERPFIVATNGQEIRVVGTVFNVQNYGGAVTVSVAEGIVDVVAAVDAAAPVRLVAGHQLVQESATSAAEIREIDTSNVGAWQDGFIVFDNAPLTQVARDLNRYFTTPIHINPSAASLTFSGILKIEDQSLVLAVLSESLPISIVTAAGSITVMLKQQD